MHARMHARTERKERKERKVLKPQRLFFSSPYMYLHINRVPSWMALV